MTTHFCLTLNLIDCLRAGVWKVLTERLLLLFGNGRYWQSLLCVVLRSLSQSRASVRHIHEGGAAWWFPFARSSTNRRDVLRIYCSSGRSDRCVGESAIRQSPFSDISCRQIFSKGSNVPLSLKKSLTRHLMTSRLITQVSSGVSASCDHLRTLSTYAVTGKHRLPPPSSPPACILVLSVMLCRLSAMVATMGFLRGEPQDCNQSLCQKQAPWARLQLIQPNNKQQITELPCRRQQSPHGCGARKRRAFFLSSTYIWTSHWFMGCVQLFTQWNWQFQLLLRIPTDPATSVERTVILVHYWISTMLNHVNPTKKKKIVYGLSCIHAASQCCVITLYISSHIWI